MFQSGRFYSEDPLWDGAGCGPQSTCCSFNNPPWFYKQLPQPTTDAIEMRVCRNEPASNEDIAIEIVEIYTHMNIFANMLALFYTHSIINF